MRFIKLLTVTLLFSVINLFFSETIRGQKIFGVEQFVFPLAKELSYFPLISNEKPVNILTDKQDYPGVLRAVDDLKDDFRKVCGNVPSEGIDKQVLIIGTVGKSAMIDQLIQDGKIVGQDLVGKNEKFLICLVSNPAPNIEKALVIAGSDKRGTIYGIYEMSSQMGVSPWYFWADVPPVKSKNLFVKPGCFTDGEPAVRYRGIFLNDEAPALTGWAKSTYDGFNHHFYEKVFELILRLKGNFLWPAMWGRSAFFVDDSLNAKLADEYGIVMGTSHHEPMGRAYSEWRSTDKGEWDYSQNKDSLRYFWTKGMERMKDYETLVTIGMRGDGDEPMSETNNPDLLQKIINDQRDIIANVTKKNAEETPQVWALYKEVQQYYDAGMRVPDDVTLLFSDDNWGNVRKLPNLGDPKRKGGYGMYYHFDYVGGPRSYKWVNISPIPRIWEQLNLTYSYGVDRIWIVNVGDLKPMEYPISFFLDMAWDPLQFNPDNLPQHTEQWCAQQFGEKYAKESARLINLYSKYNRRVTPELLNENTYSLENYNEFERVTNDYKDLAIEALRLYNQIKPEYRDAFDELVLFPINACSNLYEMYYAVAQNHYYAAKQDIQANTWAEKAKACYERDSLLTIHYNEDIAGGKWPHMMDQVRIGYTYWDQPKRRVMPKLKCVVPSSQPPLFIENDGYVSIEAEHYSRLKNGKSIEWDVIPDLGKTLSGMTTFPVTAIPNDSDNVVYLEYDIELKTAGEDSLHVFLSPTLNFNANKGLSYAVSFDGGKEQIVNFNKDYIDDGKEGRKFDVWKAESIIISSTKHKLSKGKHVLRFRVLDPGIVLQKIILDTGGLKKSYLGAPESVFQ